MSPPPSRWSLRVRLTAAATLVAVVGLVLGAVLMTTALQRAILGSLDDSARGDARDVAALVDTGRVTDPVPTFGAAVVQVIDADGLVRASSPGGDRLTPIVTAEALDAVRAGERVQIAGSRLGDPDPYLVVGEEAGLPEDRQTVLVAASLAEQRSSGDLIRRGAFFGVPPLVAAVAIATWYGVGRALRPVEALRRDASEISGTVGGSRLAVPPVDDEIARLAVTLNAMLARLETAAESQRVFVADAAHELRSPLAALRTDLEVWQAHPDRVDAAETIREALTEADRMQRLVADLLALARLDDATSGRVGVPSRTRRVALDDLAAHVAHQYTGATGPAGPVDVTLDDPPDGASAEVHGDPDALTRVIANLVDNAVRHARSRVVVTVGLDTATVRVTVSDDGDGVPETDRSRIFDRFARLDEGRSRDVGGTGLGLAIVKATVEAHHGRVTVEDAGPGARFVVTLPHASHE